MGSTTIRNVIFDVGNVLLRWDPDKMVAEQLPHAPNTTEIVDAVFRHQDWTDLDHGILEEDEGRARFLQRTGLPAEDIDRLMLASKASLTLMTDTDAWIGELATAGMQLYGLTNMSRGTFSFVRDRFAFWNRFVGTVVSAHVQQIKPDAAIYRTLLETYKLEPSESVFFDDNPTNVEGARHVGLHSFVFTDVDQARTDLASLESE